jgi:putative ABC transport system permease protein
MWFRLLRANIRRARGGFFMMLVATALGCALVSALLAVSLGVQEKISRELNRYGANIQVRPSGASLLSENDVAALKTTIFWRHNIVGLSPYLYETMQVKGPAGTSRAVVAGAWFNKRVPAQEEFRTGLKTTAPYLKLRGRWPADESRAEAVLGVAVARRIGARVGDRIRLDSGEVTDTVAVVGIVEGGGYEDQQVIVPLDHLQATLGAGEGVSQVLVSAVTVPLDSFGRRNPKTMTRREFDKWYCTAYVTSVASELQQTVKGSVAGPVWAVVEAEGKVLSQLSLLIYTLVALSLVASALAVSTTFTSNILRRRRDVGLLKALGGRPWQVGSVLLAESATAGVIASLLGFALGWRLADYIGQTVFGAPFEFGIALLPISLGTALMITITGSIVPLREAMRVPAAEVMGA